MAIKPILKLGDPGLWKKCKAVKDIKAPETAAVIRDLRDTLMDFRKKNGFGRGVAAPQIGILKRIIYIHFPKEKISGALINPKIIRKSKAQVTLWDDCFSFPGLLVKVERAREVTVACLDESGWKRMLIAAGGLAELLQHEIDHLDGILAVQRAVDGRSFALRSEWERFSKKR
ncbi:MAG: peptide deformylase [Acidobacteria bacterium]|jgi:peptide deformylase|nr:peptide deformylase [Acidobacteriota bacterium]